MAEKRSLYTPPESFSLSPLLSLLPVKGVVGNLEKLTSSFYARYEKVHALKASLKRETPSEAWHKLNAEEGMLKQVLDWLAVNTDEVD